MMARMKRRRPGKAVVPLVAASLAASAFAMTGCGWRLETPDPSPLVPDQTELARDAAAQAEARLLEALPYASPGGPGSEWMLRFEEVSAGAHVDALGGVYDPYPLPSTSPSLSPSPDPSPSANPSLGPTSYSRYAEFARNAAVEGALTVEDADLALLLASIGLSHAAAIQLQVEENARALGYEVPQIADRLLPLPLGFAYDEGPATSTDLVPASTSVPEETLVDIILQHDYAVYVCEVVAARASGELRWIAYDRSLLHEERADALVALLGYDPRGPSYVTDRSRLGSNEDMEALLAEVEGDLAVLYVRAFGEVVAEGGDSVADRAWLLSSAFDALVASWLRLPGPEDAPAFPGLSLPGYSEPEPSPSPAASPSGAA